MRKGFRTIQRVGDGATVTEAQVRAVMEELHHTYRNGRRGWTVAKTVQSNGAGTRKKSFAKRAPR